MRVPAGYQSLPGYDQAHAQPSKPSTKGKPKEAEPEPKPAAETLGNTDNPNEADEQ